jgi:hypothetical protein
MGASSNGQGLGLLNREWQFESARAYHYLASRGVPDRPGEKSPTTRFQAGSPPNGSTVDGPQFTLQPARVSTTLRPESLLR